MVCIMCLCTCLCVRMRVCVLWQYTQMMRTSFHSVKVDFILLQVQHDKHVVKLLLANTFTYPNGRPCEVTMVFPLLLKFPCSHLPCPQLPGLMCSLLEVGNITIMWVYLLNLIIYFLHLKGLMWLEKCGVVHRDLYPWNLLIDGDDRVIHHMWLLLHG